MNQRMFLRFLLSISLMVFFFSTGSSLLFSLTSVPSSQVDHWPDNTYLYALLPNDSLVIEGYSTFDLEMYMEIKNSCGLILVIPDYHFVFDKDGQKKVWYSYTVESLTTHDAYGWHIWETIGSNCRGYLTVTSADYTRLYVVSDEEDEVYYVIDTISNYWDFLKYVSWSNVFYRLAVFALLVGGTGLFIVYLPGVRLE
jgi:hypothetical protein